MRSALRVIRTLVEIALAVAIATTGYLFPLLALVLSSLLPDPTDLIIEQAPYREISLAGEEGLLDDAILAPSDQPATQDPPPSSPEPVAVVTPKKTEPPKKEEPDDQADAAPEPDIAPLPTRDDPNLRRPVTSSKRPVSDEALATRKALAEERAAGRKASGKGTKKKKCAEPTEGISQISPTEFSIDRDVVLHYANDLEAAGKLAWIDWAKNDKGKTIGFEVKRIRCGTPLDQLGLKQGDIILEINNKEIKSVVQAFTVWRKVRKKDVIRVTLKRGGKRTEFKYHIE